MAPDTKPPISGGETKKKYETMTVGVGASRKATHTALEALAAKLQCRPADLLWHAIDVMLKAPPSVAPAGASPHVGHAPGFWVQIAKNSAEKCVAVVVQEVAKRTDAVGRTFFRFKTGDDKARNRAMKQAQRAAESDAQLAGVKDVQTKLLKAA